MKLRITSLILLGVAFCRSISHGAGVHDYLKRDSEWFSTDDAKRIATNVLSFEADLGGGPNNTDTASSPYTGARKDLKPTFDNGATTDELRFLAKMYPAEKSDVYRKAIEKGIDHILAAQYPNGGWPQFYPPGKQYHRHITFNDNAMVRLMEFLRETYTAPVFAFLDEGRRNNARAAFNRGVDCILKCQIKVDGKLAAWCAQHDEIDLSPRPARTFELVSLSGAESVGIVRLLMSLDNPSPQVIAAITNAVAWFSAARVEGIKEIKAEDKGSPKGWDKKVVKDANAKPIWARFYEIGTNKPIFSGRDGVKKYDLSEIEYERRNGYAWWGYWPEPLLATEFPKWKSKWLGK